MIGSEIKGETPKGAPSGEQKSDVENEISSLIEELLERHGIVPEFSMELRESVFHFHRQKPKRIFSHHFILFFSSLLLHSKTCESGVENLSERKSVGHGASEPSLVRLTAR